MKDSEIEAMNQELEALFESRLQALTTRINKLHENSQQLYNSTQALASVYQAKFKRVYYVEDHLLRLQGKPGLSEQYLENGSQPSKGINSKDLDNFKMGVKTLRRKFQAAGAVASTVGWWRHLKDKAADKVTVSAVPVPEPAPAPQSEPIGPTQVAEAPAKAAKATKTPPPPLTIETTAPATPVADLTEQIMSPTTKKRTTLALQQLFSAPPPSTTKPAHQHYLTSPSTERANPALGLYSPPQSPHGPGPVSSLMRGLSLRS
ncbi:hypothetical protein BGZ94_002001 [Podila epigama]|nr:hypothetical protein BGZ94_002001 [Podila epigama]